MIRRPKGIRDKVVEAVDLCPAVRFEALDVRHKVLDMYASVLSTRRTPSQLRRKTPIATEQSPKSGSKSGSNEQVREQIRKHK